MALFDPMTQDTRDALSAVEAVMGGTTAEVDAAFDALITQIDTITTGKAAGLRTAALSAARGAHLLMRYGRSPLPSYGGTPAEDAAMAGALQAALMATYAANGATS